MTIRTYINITVTDLEKSVDFYQTLFGKKASKLREEYAHFAYDTPPIFLSLTTKQNEPATTNNLEFGFEVPTQFVFEEWHTRLVNSGLDYYEPQQAECCYSESRKLYFRDPEGNSWGIFLHSGEDNHLAGNDPKIQAYFMDNNLSNDIHQTSDECCGCC